VTLAAAIAAEVARRLAARGMSQNQLARAIGIPPTLIHRVVKGTRQLTLNELEAAAAVLRVRPETIIRVARKQLGEAASTDAAGLLDDKPGR
jgi:transcriptional regulator with XRE-family HTH domain